MDTLESIVTVIGCIALTATGFWVIYQAIVILILALADTYTSAQNMLDVPEEWWRWFFLPACFCEDLVRQINAWRHGYKTHTIRIEKPAQALAVSPVDALNLTAN